MTKEDYQKLVKKHTPKEPRLRNILLAFFVGGIIGFIGEFLVYILQESFYLTKTEAGTWTCLIIIGLASLLTALGFFDNWVNKCKCGLIIPTTGFAHSITSSALDYKKDGLITGLGANVFKLAGSVILYGIVSAFILAVIKVVLYG